MYSPTFCKLNFYNNMSELWSFSLVLSKKHFFESGCFFLAILFTQYNVLVLNFKAHYSQLRCSSSSFL